MLILISTFLAVVQLTSPLEAALQAGEAPRAARIAFEVELKSEEAAQVYQFDPRLPYEDRWQLVSATGEDAYLDQIAATWGAEPAPDGRLFPDDLRASIGSMPRIEDVGAAWKISFRHQASANDGPFDVWAAERLDATAWLLPDEGRFLRIDYTLPDAVRIPEGGRLKAFQQTYLLEPDPVYGLSLITAFHVSFEAASLFRTERRAYSIQTRNVEVFFATPEAEARFVAAQMPAKADLAHEPR